MIDSFSVKPSKSSTTANNNGTYFVADMCSCCNMSTGGQHKPDCPLYVKPEDHPFKSHTDSIIEIVHGVRCETCGKDLIAHMKPIE